MTYNTNQQTIYTMKATIATIAATHNHTSKHKTHHVQNKSSVSKKLIKITTIAETTTKPNQHQMRTITTPIQTKTRPPETTATTTTSTTATATRKTLVEQQPPPSPNIKKQEKRKAETKIGEVVLQATSPQHQLSKHGSEQQVPFSALLLLVYLVVHGVALSFLAFEGFVLLPAKLLNPPVHKKVCFRRHAEALEMSTSVWSIPPTTYQWLALETKPA